MFFQIMTSRRDVTGMRVNVWGNHPQMAARSNARNVMMMNEQDTPENPPNLNGNDSIFHGSWGRIWHVMMRDNQDTPQPTQPNGMYLSRVTKKMIIL